VDARPPTRFDVDQSNGYTRFDVDQSNGYTRFDVDQSNGYTRFDFDLLKIQYTELKLSCGNDPVVKNSIYSNDDLDL
jgi:hypothetical protein